MFLLTTKHRSTDKTTGYTQTVLCSFATFIKQPLPELSGIHQGHKVNLHTKSGENTFNHLLHIRVKRQIQIHTKIYSLPTTDVANNVDDI